MNRREEIVNENFNKLCELIDTYKRKLIPELNKINFFSDHLSFDEIEINDIKKLILKECLKSEENYDKLVEVSLHIGNDEMALILEPNVIDLVDLSRCHPKDGYVEKFSFYKDENDINNKCELFWKSTASESITLSDIYDMRNIPRGYCLLINNYFTKGTYKEMQKFRNIFYQLNFDVIMHKNLSSQQITQKLIDISEDESVQQHNAFVFMIITHGNSKREIVYDGISVGIDSLIELLNNKNCKALHNKPKIFFFNCCRADRDEDYDLGIDSLSVCLEEPSSSSQLLSSRRIPSQDEMFICFSTLQGYLSHVDHITGTAFGEALSQAFIQRPYKSFNDILVKANRLLKEQISQKCTTGQLNDWYQNQEDRERAIQDLFKFASRIFSWEQNPTRNIWFNMTDKRTID